jgi:16S rRNA (cytosine1402-N4)-methyltransferase
VSLAVPEDPSSQAAPPAPHQRRPRYSGRNPRRFEEKYKEHDPEKYSADVAKVVTGGRTPAGTHRPIMVREVVEVLAPKPGDFAVDCTLGYGGHARELLAAIQPGGKLIGLDVDPIELPKTEARLRSAGFATEALAVHRSNFAGLAKILSADRPEGADLILADLGVSSMQIDNPSRGFTYKVEGPLDLRMNPSRGQSAAEYLGAVAETKLAAVLDENSDEPLAIPLARVLISVREQSPIRTTTQLAGVIRSGLASIAPHHSKTAADDTIRRVFQALRIAVNDEFSALDTFLRNLPACLAPGGRVAILTFHSGEDRRVKKAFQAGEAAGVYSAIAREVGRPGPDEVRGNPRCSSAKLRWAIRTK